MRHVKLRPESEVDASALVALIDSAYTDMKKRLNTVGRAAIDNEGFDKG
jgi:hypothetical protein